ncbi:glycosyltransferase [Floridanema aerugineum]|uniref:Glycosyltransferase n=1 Tax=Floridaenema aerugineum BLCC-F46 TaxID=3153654 RepID=A0ABV4XHS6_9CYAN
MPLISVIIPVYNGEKTIQETVESVLNQTFKDWELIIINDGSQDATLDIVSRIEDPRIKVFSYPNAGLATSRNRGIDRASGEFISFLDADDLWTADKLELQLKALQENSQAAVAYSWTDLIDESSKFIRPSSHITANGDVYARLLLVNFLENGSNPLICKQALTEVGGFDESLSGAADWDLWLRLAVRYQFVAVPYSQILYRVSANSMSRNIPTQAADQVKVLKKVFEQIPESLQYLKNSSYSNMYKYLIYRCFEGLPTREKGLAASQFLWFAIKNEPSLCRSGITWKVLLKIITVILLPAIPAQKLFTKFPKLFNTNTLLGYIKYDVS